MSNSFNKLIIPNLAEKVLKNNKITSLPVDLTRIYSNSGITVQPKQGLSPGVSGMLIRVGDNFGILYSEFYHNEGFERFSIAHELGHYFIEGHVEKNTFNGKCA